MDFNADTPRVERTIAGVKVSVIAPYAEGQTINAGEAAMLNQTLAENFSNNLREKIGEYVPEGTYSEQNPAPEARVASAEEAQSIVDKYMGEYAPGVRRAGAGGARTLDPIEKEMKIIASGKLDELLKSKNLTRKKVDFAALLSKLISDNEDALRKSAEKIVAARDKQSANDLDVAGIEI